MEELEGSRVEFRLKRLAVHPTGWSPSDIEVSMNLRLDGCIVPSQTPEGARVSFSHIVVIDKFLDKTVINELRDFLTMGHLNQLPESKWERQTADMKGAAGTWGVVPSVLESLAQGYPDAVVEIQSRLSKLYPEYDIVHMPSQAIQRPSTGTDSFDCSAFLANAAVEGDSFRFHVDADPTSFSSESEWTQIFGDYFNGEPGKPLLVSMIVYLNDDWDRDWAADTLFLDSGTDTGVFVRPKLGRVVLMDQDVLHRVSAPSGLAGGRFRLSLVWKLAFLRKSSAKDHAEPCISRPEWGKPVSFGSGARVYSMLQEVARSNRKS